MLGMCYLILLKIFLFKKKKNPEKRASSEALSIQHSLAANRIKSGCY